MNLHTMFSDAAAAADDTNAATDKSLTDATLPPNDHVYEEETEQEEEVEEKPELKEKVEQEVEQEEEESDGPEASSIYQDLNKHLGFEIEAPEGFDIDSLSTYVERVAAIAKAQGLETLKQRAPKSHAILEYELNGGNPDDLYIQNTPEILDIQEDDVSMQRAILSRDYQARGLGAEEIEMLLDNLQSNGNIYNAAVKVNQANASKRAEEIQTKIQTQAAFAKRVENIKMNKRLELQQAVSSGTVGNIKIPPSKREAFMQFLDSAVHLSGTVDQPELQLNLSIDTLDKLSLAYYAFVGGDLSQLAASNTRTLKLKAKAKSNSTSKPKSLQDLFNN